MPSVDSVLWNGVDSATERGEQTKLPRRREGSRVSENSEGGGRDCQVESAEPNTSEIVAQREVRFVDWNSAHTASIYAG